MSKDRRGSPFALINFRRILSASRQGVKGVPFHNLFMAKFMEYKFPAMREPRVWLWIVKQDKVSVITELYEEPIKFKYNIFYYKFVHVKTQRIVAINEARGNKQVGAVNLIFLTYNVAKHGHAPIKANNAFMKIYNILHPPSQGFLAGDIVHNLPDIELIMEFYISVLQDLKMDGTVYNIFRGSIFMYAAMVSHLPGFTSVCS